MHLVEGSQLPRVVIDGKSVVNLCSNNYLGLACDPRLKEAAIKAIGDYGLGSTASRLVCGNMTLHCKLEEKLAQFKNTESALVFSCGYMANLGIISSVMDREGIIFSDKLNHASIVDGIILSRADFKRYPHKDIKALETLLTNSDNSLKKLIITDTVFSMDGDIAPLKEIAFLSKRYNTMVMVDEAHATGVFGPIGNGIVAYLGLSKEIDIQMGTLSKAIGTHGAYVCGSKELIDFLINFSRPFIYTTALPPAIAAASIKAIEIIENEPQLREKLWDNVKFMKDSLSDLGFDTLESNSPIIPVLISHAKQTMEFSSLLFNEGIFIQGIRPPTVPEGQARLRVTVTAAHKQEDLEFAIETIKKIGKRLCLI